MNPLYELRRRVCPGGSSSPCCSFSVCFCLLSISLFLLVVPLPHPTLYFAHSLLLRIPFTVYLSSPRVSISLSLPGLMETLSPDDEEILQSSGLSQDGSARLRPTFETLEASLTEGRCDIISENRRPNIFLFGRRFYSPPCSRPPVEGACFRRA